MSIKETVIKKCEVRTLTAPLVTPFRIATGQHDRLENVFISLELACGIRGYGEAAIATHITGETVRQTEDNLVKAGEALVGSDVVNYEKISRILAEKLKSNKSALAALEMAMLDSLARYRKVPLRKLYGRALHRTATDITIVIGTLDDAKTASTDFYRRGFRAFKIKIGKETDLDLARVKAVRKCAPRAKIYLDANQAFTADSMLKFLKSLSRSGVVPALVEQPVPKRDIEGLKKVTRLSKIPICADESASSLADARRLIREKAADVINIKLMKTAILESREIMDLARKHKTGLMIGSMMESPLSVMAAAHIAAGSGSFTYVDLDTPFFIRPGTWPNPYVRPNGVFDLSKIKAGIGIIPF